MNIYSFYKSNCIKNCDVLIVDCEKAVYKGSIHDMPVQFTDYVIDYIEPVLDGDNKTLLKIVTDSIEF